MIIKPHPSITSTLTPPIFSNNRPATQQMRHNVATKGRRNIKDLSRGRQSQTLLYCSMWIKVARLQRHLSPEKACNKLPHGVGEPHCPHIHALTHTHVHDKWPRAAKLLHANACLVCVCLAECLYLHTPSSECPGTSLRPPLYPPCYVWCQSLWDINKSPVLFSGAESGAVER